MTFPIAVSTGWLFAHDQATEEMHRRIIDAACGAELSVADEERLSVYNGTGLDTGIHCSFHFPHNPTNVDLLRTLAQQYEPHTTVIHPTALTPDEIAALDCNDNLNLAVENMDIRKDRGRTCETLAEYVKHDDLGFVLDVQHVYEHDQSMEYAWDLLDLAGDSLQQLHVSGETHNNPHALVKDAENRDAILTFLREAYDVGVDVPMVLEGEYQTPKDVREEVAVIRDNVF